MIPIINKPTRVTNKTSTAIDHILANSYTEAILKTALLKCVASDNFPICLITSPLKFSSKNKVIYIYKRSFNEQSIINCKKKLFEIYWQKSETLKKIKIKAKDLQSHLDH